MTLPVGITTCTVTVGSLEDFAGEIQTINVTWQPVLDGKPAAGNVRSIVWEATGQALASFPERITPEAGEVSFDAPHVDQPGFIDGTGAAVTGWWYRVKVTARDEDRKTYTKTKDIQVVVGQDTVDFDLIPDGTAVIPATTPTAAVTSVNGQTGAVTVGGGGGDGYVPTSRTINGHDLTADVTLDADDIFPTSNVIIGSQALLDPSATFLNIAIGDYAGTALESGSGQNVFLGPEAGKTPTNALRTVAIGNLVDVTEDSFDVIAIGSQAVAGEHDSIAIGHSAVAPEANGVSVGDNTVTGHSGTAVGGEAEADDYGTSLGHKSVAAADGVAIGHNAVAPANAAQIVANDLDIKFSISTGATTVSVRSPNGTKQPIGVDNAGLLTGPDVSAADVVETSTKKVLTDTERSKLAGVATAATANQSDATTNAAISAAQAAATSAAQATSAQRASNLSDLANTATARTNLGLGTAATQASTAFQAADTDLTTIAGLAATTDNVIQSVAGAWASRTMAQFKTTLAMTTSSISDFASAVATLLTTERSAVATLTNKRITPRVLNVANTATLTVDWDAVEVVNLTAQAGPVTIAFAGTPTDGQPITISIKDDGTSRAITPPAAIRLIGVTIPASTTVNKRLVFGGRWNAADAKLWVFALGQEP